MIQADSIVKNFGKTPAVDNISFNIAEGEHAVLLGTSGSGKTTTLRMINRLVEISSGRITVAGEDIKSISPEDLRRSIGYVLQNHGLFPHYTVAQNIAIVPGLLKWDAVKTRKRIEELIEQLHLSPELLQKYPQELSGGQQQRVGLARALAADPPVLLMDEPFGALDVITRESITREFAHLEVLKKKTIVMVTHDVREAFQMGDKILLMDKGKIVQEGTPADLLFHPTNEFVSKFFDTQRLQYELNTVLLKQVWPYLNTSGDSNEHFAEVSADLSLWDALNVLSEKGTGGLAIHSEDQTEKKYALYDSLFTALAALKNQDG